MGCQRFHGLRDAPKAKGLLRGAAQKATSALAHTGASWKCLGCTASELPDKLPSMKCLIQNTVLLLLAQQLLTASARPYSAHRFARPARTVAGVRSLRTRALLQDFGGVSSLRA